MQLNLPHDANSVVLHLGTFLVQKSVWWSRHFSGLPALVKFWKIYSQSFHFSTLPDINLMLYQASPFSFMKTDKRINHGKY